MKTASSNHKPKHVFVVMLENRSFDNMLGKSGFTPSICNNYNTYNKKKYSVETPAPTTMIADPKHGLPDVLQQLTNIRPKDWQPPLGAYPRNKIPKDFANESGFAANYASIKKVRNENMSEASTNHIGDIMKVFSPGQLPVLNTLAKEFAVCSNWYSSVPGPTWPNRFFLHFASSNGLDTSPSRKQIEKWITYGAFPSPENGSVFQALTKAGCKYRIYNDCNATLNPFSDNFCASDFSDDPANGGNLKGLGWIPQVGSISGIKFKSWSGIKHNLAKDLNDDYDCQYTFIEPHYGNVYANSYQGGSSQHPLDDVYGGENLVKFVYETLRNSAIWEDSLLVITYDEHGGFYDSVAPPSALPPNDGSPTLDEDGSLNKYGFEFDQYGVRVPAIIVSPYIKKATVDKSVYDHSSVIATITALFSTDKNPIGPLTDRDKAANDVLDLLTLPTPRTDCPIKLPDPIAEKSLETVSLTQEERVEIDSQNLPESGNLIGAMWVLIKMDIEVSAQTTEAKSLIRSRVADIKTKGQLKAYASEVLKKVDQIKHSE